MGSAFEAQVHRQMVENLAPLQPSQSAETGNSTPFWWDGARRMTTNLTAESALETARSFQGPEANSYSTARALIQTRIEAMQDCAKAGCRDCHDGLPIFEHDAARAIFHRSSAGGEYYCDTQFEQREIARLKLECEKLQ